MSWIGFDSSLDNLKTVGEETDDDLCCSLEELVCSTLVANGHVYLCRSRRTDSSRLLVVGADINRELFMLQSANFTSLIRAITITIIAYDFVENVF